MIFPQLDSTNIKIVKISKRLTYARRLQHSHWFVSSLLLLGLLTGCTIPSHEQPVAKSNISQTPVLTRHDRPNVVVTNTVLCDLTRQIAAETVNLFCLLAPGIDPHIYKLTPADRQSIEDAQLVLYGGYNLEPELIKAIKATSNQAPKVAVYELAVPHPQEFAEDGNSTIDPHVWHNAKHGMAIAKVIETNLINLLHNRDIYQKNTQKLTVEIGQLDLWIKDSINTIPARNKVLFTTHDSLGYYSKAYGIPVAALAGLSTEEKPNAARARELIEKIKKTKVPTIYTEVSLNPQLIKTIAKAANVKISTQEIYADGLGKVNSAGGTYQNMLISNTKAIVEGLGGKYRNPR